MGKLFKFLNFLKFLNSQFPGYQLRKYGKLIQLFKLLYQIISTCTILDQQHMCSITTATRGHDDNDITINLNCHLGTYYISSISLIRAHFFIVTFFKRKRELPGIPITRIVWRNVHPNYPNRQTLEFRSLCIHYICMHLSNFCKRVIENENFIKI